MKETYYWISAMYSYVMAFGLTIGALSYIAKMTDLWVMCWGICGFATLIMVIFDHCQNYNEPEDKYYED